MAVEEHARMGGVARGSECEREERRRVRRALSAKGAARRSGRSGGGAPRM